MSAPLLLFVATGLLGLVAVALRRRAAPSAVVAAAGCLVLGFLALTARLDEPVRVLGASLKIGSSLPVMGREFVVDPSNRSAVVFLYVLAAFVFGGAWAARPPRYLFPVGVLAVGVVSASLMVRPFLYAAVFLELAAMGGVLVLASPGRVSTRGAVRLVSLYTLAMIAILLAGWMLDSLGVARGAPDVARRTALLLGLGLGIVLAVPPFHHWLPAAADETHPYALAFVATLLQSAGVFFVLKFLDSYEWLRAEAAIFAAMRGAGAVTILFGSLGALSQRTFARTMAYAVLAGYGVTLVAIGTQTAHGYQAAMGLVGAHAIGFAVCALGLVGLVRGARGEATALQGSGLRAPLAATAVLVGLLTIGGFPLTAGFPARWALLPILAGSEGWVRAAVLFGVLAVAGSAVRWLHRFLRAERAVRAEVASLGESLFLAGGIALCLFLGVFPQLLASVFLAVRGLSNLVP